MNLEGRKAVVTGASTGIGRAVALELAAHGAQVAINYRHSESAAREVVAQINEQGSEAAAFQADVSDAKDVAKLVAQTHDYLGAIDIWANVAGADILTGAGAEIIMCLCN